MTLAFLIGTWRHYAWWQLALMLSVMLAAMIIGGSLIVGDSARETLRQQSQQRLGHVQTVLIGNERFFTTSTAQAIDPQAAPIIVVKGSLSLQGGAQRLNDINIIGIDARFGSMAPTPWVSTLTEARPNSALAQALGDSLSATEPVVIRLEKPGALSRDATFSGEADQSITLRLPLGAALTSAQFGSFSLTNTAEAPLTLFVPLSELQSALDQPDRINALLSREATSTLDDRWQAAWTMDDLGLTLTEQDVHGWQLMSSRVFLDPPLVTATQQVFPQSRGGLTYLINDLTPERAGASYGTPYSFAAAIDGLFPLRDDEIILTDWAAQDLSVAVGERVTMTFYQATRAEALAVGRHTFTVKEILPPDHPAVQRSWTPNYPGLSDSESCREWKAGVAIDFSRIRPQDEDYWKKFHSTPKAFIALSTAQQLWKNRFGTLTSLHWPKEAMTSAAEFLPQLKNHFRPADVGFVLADVKKSAQQAVDNSYDLGLLFISLSFFLIVTAIALAALLFLFLWESRAPQLGLMKSLGFSPWRLQSLAVIESLPATILGGILGAGAAWGYGHLLIRALNQQWAGAVNSQNFTTTVRPVSLICAAVTSVGITLLVVWWTARRLARQHPQTLMTASKEMTTAGTSRASHRAGHIAAIVITAGLTLAWISEGRELFFFGAATLLLIGGLFGWWWIFSHWRQKATWRGLSSLRDLSSRYSLRHPRRSLSTVGLIAAGLFLVCALAAFRLNARTDADQPQSGTGGFTHLATSTLPLYDDLHTAAGQRALGFEPEELREASFVPARVRPGDEASCLSLARPQSPRLLGLDPAHLQARGAFTFAGGVRSWQEWATLPSDTALPVIMDANYVRYTLKARVGDHIPLPEAAAPSPRQMKIVGLLQPSVLQGSVLLRADDFARAFPASGGSSFFLISLPEKSAPQLSSLLTRQLASRGFSLFSAPAHLDRFHAVQNTYLTIFSQLGGLSLLLATIGLGLVLARSVLERQAEFGLLQAIGFPHAHIRRLVLHEYGLLFLSGMLLGLIAALVVVWPVLRAPQLPWHFIISLGLCGLIFCYLGAFFTLQRPLLHALRRE